MTKILAIIKIEPPAPMDYDVLMKESDGTTFGLDFDRDGYQGCHFYLQPHEMHAYRKANRRKRVAFEELPEKTQRAINTYLES